MKPLPNWCNVSNIHSLVCIISETIVAVSSSEIKLQNRHDHERLCGYMGRIVSDTYIMLPDFDR